MKITATSKFNYKTIKNFVRTMAFYKTNPLKKLITYCEIFAVLSAVILLEMYLLDNDPVFVVALIVAILAVLFELYLYFVLPRIRYNALGQMKGCTNEFTFTDDSIRQVSYDNGYSGESRIDYKVLSRAIETSVYFYIFQTKSQAMVVEKATIEGGTAEELRMKLQSVLGKKYKIYNY